MPVPARHAGGGPHRKVNTVLLAASSGGSSWSWLIMMILFFGIVYFLLIRPQQRRAQQARSMQAGIGPGDEVVTIGGMFGTVESIDDQFVFLQVAPGVVTKYRRQAIAQVVAPGTREDDGVEEADTALDDRHEDADMTADEPADDHVVPHRVVERRD